MPLPHVMIIGNLTADPELKYTSSGTAIANMRVASQDRKRDDTTGQWTDGPVTYIDVTAWRQTAQNAAESLSKGDRVVVWGRLRQRSYEAKDGTNRTVFEVEADDLAVSLYRTAANVRRVTREAPTAPADDPWTTSETPF